MEFRWILIPMVSRMGRMGRMGHMGRMERMGRMGRMVRYVFNSDVKRDQTSKGKAGSVNTFLGLLSRDRGHPIKYNTKAHFATIVHDPPNR